jgi:hypothetical protein
LLRSPRHAIPRKQSGPSSSATASSFCSLLSCSFFVISFLFALTFPTQFLLHDFRNLAIAPKNYNNYPPTRYNLCGAGVLRAVVILLLLSVCFWKKCVSPKCFPRRTTVSQTVIRNIRMPKFRTVTISMEGTV